VTVKESPYSFKNPVLWGVLILYTIVAVYTMLHHELWGDEVHSWNIAKASVGFLDLIANTRYVSIFTITYTRFKCGNIF